MVRPCKHSRYRISSNNSRGDYFYFRTSGESNCWPQFPVTLKTHVVEITYPIKPQNVSQSIEEISRSHVRAPRKPISYHMIRNSIVKSLGNMKIRVTISQSCKTTRHAIKTFLTHSPIKVRCNFNIVSYWYSIDFTAHCILESERIIAKQNDHSFDYKCIKQFRY